MTRTGQAGGAIAPAARPVRFGKVAVGVRTSERRDKSVKQSGQGSLFDRAAKRASGLTGRPIAFGLAVAVLLVWAVTGPFFGFNDTWQLVINTGTTIVTFLMVFLIQNSQNRDTAALQIKLDELVRVLEGADNRLLDLEEFGAVELERKRLTYEEIARAARGEQPPEKPA